MSFTDLVNCVLRVKRNQKVGTEDGTPIFAEVDVNIRGWFDELAQAQADAVERDTVNLAVKRSLVLVDADADLHGDDSAVILMDGPDGPGTGPNLGRWSVSIIRAAAEPGGVSHLEVIMEKGSETG